jgi:phosphohistidine phosphatase SixA
MTYRFMLKTKIFIKDFVGWPLVHLYKTQSQRRGLQSSPFGGQEPTLQRNSFAVRFKIGYPLVFSLFLLLISTACAQTTSEAELWEVVKTGEGVAVMRHAIAPGTGDPDNFQLGDCSTQRNLDETGREQARMIGERIRSQGISEMVVVSSQWCRCLETAQLLDLGAVTENPNLNSFFGDRSTEETQTANIREFITSYDGALPLMLVTHQVNITALTGITPASGEMIVLRKTGDGFEVVGSITN